MNEKRDKVKHIAFTESETKNIKKYSDYYNMTDSEFIRQAINDKILRIEKPESFTTSSVSNQDFSNQMIKYQESILEELKLMKKKFNTINGIKKDYKSLSSLISEGTLKENLKLKTDKIKDVMKTHDKAFTPKELKDITGLDLKSIDITLTSNPNIFKINMNGRWVLK